MNYETVKFLVGLLERLEDIRSRFRFMDFKYEIETHEDKEYVSLEMKFERANAKFSDCALFYYNDGFDSEEFLSNMDEITQKADRLLNS